MLYIFWFLHQTTTNEVFCSRLADCISFDSYIKPQLRLNDGTIIAVVYLLIPTSNHNLHKAMVLLVLVVYLLIPTSNHNLSAFIVVRLCVVYLLIPTSNHNSPLPHAWWAMVVYLLIPTSNHNSHRSENHPSTLYIFWFLHQTTTMRPSESHIRGCISFDSYIKPQLCDLQKVTYEVVYFLIPTSNHN